MEATDSHMTANTIMNSACLTVLFGNGIAKRLAMSIFFINRSPFSVPVTPDTPRAFVHYEHLMIRDRLPANEVRYCHNLPWFAMVHPVTGGTGVPL